MVSLFFTQHATTLTNLSRGVSNEQVSNPEKLTRSHKSQLLLKELNSNLSAKTIREYGEELSTPSSRNFDAFTLLTIINTFNNQIEYRQAAINAVKILRIAKLDSDIEIAEQIRLFTERIIKQEFPLTDDENRLKNLNLKILSEDEVRLDAGTLNSKKQLLLLRIVKFSIHWKEYAKAAANAATILVKSRFSFSNQDLSGIRIPHANLSEGIFENALFNNANLSNVNLRNCCLNKTNFLNTKVKDVELGLQLHNLPHSSDREPVKELIFSSDGNYLLSRGACYINIWNTISGHTLHVKRSCSQIVRTIFFPNKLFLISCRRDGLIKLYPLSLGHKKDIFYLPDSIDCKVEDAQFSFDGTFLILLKTRNSTASKIDVVQFFFQQIFSNESQNISAIQKKTVSFPYKIKKICISPQSNQIATASGSQTSVWLRVLSIPNMEEVAVCKLESEILDMHFFPNSDCLIIVKKTGLFCWNWQQEPHPQKLFTENFRLASDLRVIPYGNSCIFGYILNETLDSLQNNRPVLHIRNSSGKSLCKFALDNMGNSPTGLAHFNISKDGLTAVIAREKSITVLPTNSLINSISYFSISYFKKKLINGGFIGKQQFQVFDGLNSYFFHVLTGRLMRTEKSQNKPKNIPESFVCIRYNTTGTFIEFKHQTSSKVIQVPIWLRDAKEKPDLLYTLRNNKIIKTYTHRPRVTLTNTLYWEVSSLIIWLLEWNSEKKEILYSYNSPFVMLVTSQHFLLINTEKSECTQLSWPVKFLMPRSFSLETLKFDVLKNLCSIYYKPPASTTGTLFLWDIVTGEILDTAIVPFQCTFVTFCPDEPLLACIVDNGVRMWQVTENNRLKLLWRIPIFLEMNDLKSCLPDWDPKYQTLLKQDRSGRVTVFERQNSEIYAKKDTKIPSLNKAKWIAKSKE